MGHEVGAIEEYKALRAEILQLIGRRSTNLNFLLVVCLGAIGVGVETGTPELPLAASLVAALLWQDDFVRIGGQVAIGTYIQVFLESRLPDLRWESAINSRFQDLQSGPFGWAERWVPWHLLYPVFIWFDLGVGLWLHTEWSLWLSAIVLLYATLTILLLLRRYDIAAHERDRQIERWKRIAATMGV